MMESGKKNWMQILTLLLCAVLLALNLLQYSALSELREQLRQTDRGLSQLEDTVGSVSSRVSREVAEAVRLTTAHELKITGVDGASRSLLAEALVTLREWRADTRVVLLATLAEKTLKFPMEGDGNGLFTAALALPVEDAGTLSLAVMADSGGTITREELDSWGDIAMLLPVQAGGWGSTKFEGYDFDKGLLTLGDYYDFSVENDRGSSIQVQSPVFRVYVNDVPVAEQAARLDASGVYEDYYNYCVEGPWEPVSCKVGDEVLIAFACTDENGLTYEFTHARWKIAETGPEQTYREDDDYPRLTWPS